MSMGSVFDGMNASSEFVGDVVKLERLTGELFECSNERPFSLIRPLLSHRPETSQKLRVLSGVLHDVPSNVDGAV